MAFITRNIGGVVFHTSTLLSAVPHGFSTRRGGVSRPPWDSLNLGPSRGDDLNAVKENYRRFCAAVGEAYRESAAHSEADSGSAADHEVNSGSEANSVSAANGEANSGNAAHSEANSVSVANGEANSGSVTDREAKAQSENVFINPRRAVLAKQVHETTVRPVTAADAGKGLYRERDFTADALITDEADLPLVVFSADCGIILLHDTDSGAVGAVHAGWRGCAGGIVEKAVRAMGERYGAKAGSLRAAVGPCIGPCCFETDADVPDAMRRALGADAEPYLERRGAKWQVDLAGLNRLWLLRGGLSQENIDVCGICTACRPEDYWSHRRMGEARGVQTALIMREADG